MSKKNGKSSGEGIIKFANFLQVVFSIICILMSGILIFAGVTAKNGEFAKYGVTAEDSVPFLVLGIFFLVLGLISIAIYAMFLRCFGEIAVDLHCIRNSNATIAEFIDRVEATKRAKNQQ